MQIHQESHDGHQIKTYESGGSEPGFIVIKNGNVTETIRENILLTPEVILRGLDLASLPVISDEIIETIIQLKPDMVLFGCGIRQERIPAVINARLAKCSIGSETMTTTAACHTYTVLANEYRRVLALLKI